MELRGAYVTKMTGERFPATRLSYKGRENFYFILYFIFTFFLTSPHTYLARNEMFYHFFFFSASPIAKTGKS